ncbi:MAG: hypothetical protein HPY76_10130 [Anaerolineae bacterium]|nr:hypothetical protein [Anaerolineae bacterium]
MNANNTRVVCLALLAALLLGGCNLPLGAEPTTDMNLIQTAAAQTVEALATAAAASPIPPGGDTATPFNTLPPAVSTATPQGAATLTPSRTPANTEPPPPPATAVPCDAARFEDDVTVPDNTTFGPATTFNKTWRLRNVGSCTWSTNYKLVFDSGNAMEGPAAVNFTSTVAPNQTVDLTVTLKSPSANGTYQGFWKLQNASGARFGIGAAATSPFWVKIVVAATETPFAVTSVNISAIPTSSDVCPTTFTFSASMTTSAAGEVTYFWEFSDGSKSAKKTFTFDKAGTQSLPDETWELNATGNHWAKIYVEAPNNQYFGPRNISLTCP